MASNCLTSFCLGFLWLVAASDGHKCLNYSDFRDDSVLKLRGKALYDLKGEWFVLSSHDPTQPSYHGICSCTRWNMTVYSNYTEDDLYLSECNLPWNPPLHFKGRFVPTAPGLWYATTSIHASSVQIVLGCEGTNCLITIRIIGTTLSIINWFAMRMKVGRKYHHRLSYVIRVHLVCTIHALSRILSMAVHVHNSFTGIWTSEV